jgi:hypothetical protein
VSESGELRATLYGSDIHRGDIPLLREDIADTKRRLTRVEWGMIAVLAATGAQGLGTLLGGA